MKYLPVIYFLLFTLTLNAQKNKESISHHQETGFFEDQQFVNAYDFVFQTFEETKSLFKLDLTGVILNPPFFSERIHYSIRHVWGLDYELKLGQEFSLNHTLNLHYSLQADQEGVLVIGRNHFQLDLGIQPRWYHGMKKRINAGESANNLSGNYFGLGVLVSYQ